MLYILSSIAFFLFFRFNLISLFLERIAWHSSIEYLGSLLVSECLNKLNTKDYFSFKVTKRPISIGNTFNNLNFIVNSF